jgi:hypothetical protein
LPIATTVSPISRSSCARGHRRIALGDLEHRQVDVAVGAQHVGLELAPVLQQHQDARRALDDVGVGHHDPGRIDDQARAERLRLPGAPAEERTEERVDLAHDRLGGDVDHRRRDAPTTSTTGVTHGGPRRALRAGSAVAQDDGVARKSSSS